MRSPQSLVAGLAVLVVALWCVPGAEATANRCVSGKQRCVAKNVAALLRCHAKAEQEGRHPVDDPVIQACLQKARDRFDGGATPAKGCFRGFEDKGGCLTTFDSPTIESQIDAFVDDVVHWTSTRRTRRPSRIPAPLARRSARAAMRRRGSDVTRKRTSRRTAFQPADDACIAKARRSSTAARRRARAASRSSRRSIPVRASAPTTPVTSRARSRRSRTASRAPSIRPWRRVRARPRRQCLRSRAAPSSGSSAATCRRVSRATARSRAAASPSGPSASWTTIRRAAPCPAPAAPACRRAPTPDPDAAPEAAPGRGGHGASLAFTIPASCAIGGAHRCRPTLAVRALELDDERERQARRAPASGERALPGDADLRLAVVAGLERSF